MMCECFTKVDMGLTILATSVADEYDGEWRLFDDRVIVWLVGLLLETLVPTCVNLESCVSRWYENVTLWSARNYVEPTLYFGVLSRTPRAHATAQPHVRPNASKCILRPSPRWRKCFAIVDGNRLGQ